MVEQQIDNAKKLGQYLADLRKINEYTLRQVEELTGKQVSNAYLSQMENGQVKQPSPNILFALAEVYSTSYENLMERAGYISKSERANDGDKHGKVATHAIENLTLEEEDALLTYLAVLRTRKGG